MQTIPEPNPARQLPPGVRLEISLGGLTWGRLRDALALINVDPDEEVLFLPNADGELVAIVIDGPDTDDEDTEEPQA